MFFLYPQYAISDVIPEFIEDVTFEMHLERMFPPKGERPTWDVDGSYVVDNLVLYAITHRKRLLKVGKKNLLRHIFKASRAKSGEPKDGLEVKDGCLTFVVLTKGAVEYAWVEEFKKQRGW